MHTHRKRPVPVTARQFTASSMYDTLDWIRTQGGAAFEASGDAGPVLLLRTLEGTLLVHPGDWIVRGVKDEFHPVRGDIFPETYEPITAQQPADAPPEVQSELQVWPLARVLAEVRCGSADWTWDEEWADLDRRHAETGYLTTLERQISENGITMPVLIGTDGRLWDGHHRLRIAVRLGIPYVPVEIPQPDTRPYVRQPATQPAPPTAGGWAGATEIVPDREVQRLAGTGLVGYRQDGGRLLHCLHHKPVPASRCVDFEEVTADDLPDGGICVHPRCGADLLAVHAAAGT